MQPFDYRLQVQNPVAMALAGYQQGNQMQTQRVQAERDTQMYNLQMEQFQQQRRTLEQEKARAAEIQTVMGDVAGRLMAGGVKPEEIVSIGLQYPEISEQINSAYETLTEAQKQGSIRELSRFAVALSRSPEVALQLVDERIAAAEEAGLVDEVQQLKAMKSMAEMDPSAPLAATMIELGVLMKPEEFSNFMKVAMPATPEAASAEGKVLQDYRNGFFGEYGTPEAQAKAQEAILNLQKPGQIINVGGELSPGFKKRDELFADIALQWDTGGGSDALKQLVQLEDVITRIDAGENVSGGVSGFSPDLVRAFADPNAQDAKDTVEEVVQRNLKAILGAQFTAQEGAELIKRAFNAKLSPEINRKRLQRLFTQMRLAAEQKQSMVEFFNQNGTLQGFQGKQPSMTDFYMAIDAPEAASAPGRRRFDAQGREIK
jgi:hypothetical protein